MLKDQEPLNPNEEYVSYDVESLFTNIPVDETINYIINEIYQKKKLPQICSKTIFKRLLYKLTTEVSFQFNYKLFKQTDGCTMGGPLSVTLSDIHMIRMETDVVVPIRPIFYKRYVDDIYNRRQKNTCDVLYNAINNYHPKIKLTIETNPQRFLDTEIAHINGTIETRVHRKKTKLPIPRTSNIPKRYKRNSIKTELYRAKRISSNFTSEVTVIRNKFESTGYPKRFVNSIIREFNAVKENDESDFIIPPWLFEGKKKVVLVETPFCLKNEISSKHFIKKFNKFTKNTFAVRIKWLTQKVKNLIRVKDKSLHQACKIYKGICSCGESYIGERVRNVEVRWGEHNNPTKVSNPSKHIKDNVDHVFHWSVIARAPTNAFQRKVLEAYYIVLEKPSLNDQLEPDRLNLFRNGVT